MRTFTVTLMFAAVIALTGCSNTSTEATSEAVQQLQAAYEVDDLHEVCDTDYGGWARDYKTITSTTPDAITIDTDADQLGNPDTRKISAKLLAASFIRATRDRAPEIKHVTITADGETLATLTR